MAKTNNAKWLPGLAIASILLIGSTGASAQAETDNDETRLSVSKQLTRADRDRGLAGNVTTDEFAKLQRTGKRPVTKQAGEQSKTSSVTAQSPNTDFWIYSADVVLFNDNDGDGFFHGVDLLFDADTYYNSAEVYAVVYLSLEGGPWNEYAATENFIINGAAADDEYVIVTELVNGYPSGSYDLLIELFDTYDDAFVASYGPNDTSELAFLQLEDAGRDAPQGTTTVIVKEGGGGSFGWLTVLLLGAAMIGARRA